MSLNSKKRKLTAKEEEILERQRRVAANLARTTTANGASGTVIPAGSSISNQGDKKSVVSAVVSKQSSLLKMKNQRDRVQKILKESIPSDPVDTTSSTITAATQKRPTLKAKSSEAAIIAARRRALLEESMNKNIQSSALVSSSAAESKSLNNAKKTSSTLSNLISASCSTALQGEKMSQLDGGNYGEVEPDDFWRNIRDWDFVTNYVESHIVRPNANDAKASAASKEESDYDILKHKKALPDRFVSHRHYIASWAPLCLAEMRAQLLQEVTTTIKKHHFIPVSIETNNKNIGSCLDCLVVLVKSNVHSTEHSFHANDACLLIPEKHSESVQNILLSSKAPSEKTNWRNCALLGHTEFARKSVDGLQLKVSKKWWAKIHDSDCNKWKLLKLGCNITALREFTALCRMESIPLTKYLLGQHLEPNAIKKSNTSIVSKTALLEKMGGKDKLGKGFTTYAQNKFNPSQLMAISASASDYGDGGFTLIKGPPGTGKTTTLVAILNSLHIRQFNQYYEELRRIAGMVSGNRKVAVNIAVKAKPRMLVCAPSNAAVDNIILKIMEDGFVDGSGKRYNPSMIRVGVGKSVDVKDVALENQVDAILSEHLDLSKLESSIAGYKMELQRIQNEISRLRARILAITNASPWPLSKDWEIRVDDAFETTGRVFFVNHKEKKTSYECPPPPEPGEVQFEPTAMPEYRAFMAQVVKLYENYNSVTNKLERCTITQGALNGGNSTTIRQQLETNILDTVHIVMTTLGTAGNRVLEASQKFEVVVVDEAAQSVEPATLAALYLGSKHAILVGDPQQLPATIFNVSGRNTKYDRSLFQRMEEAGHEVFMLNEQYRMHPKISHFPRIIFYGGDLKDGCNVTRPDYGGDLQSQITNTVPAFQPFTVLDLDSREERGGNSYANATEAKFAVHIFCQLRDLTNGLSAATRVAVITPYSQQAALLRRTFEAALGPQYAHFIEINTVDAFQGREANIVIFSCVRAAGSHGIGFLSDVRRMNVALTRAKHFLFVIARCKSIIVNPYWRDLVEHARANHAVVDVPITMMGNKPHFPELYDLNISPTCPSEPERKVNDPRKQKRDDPRKRLKVQSHSITSIPRDPRKPTIPPPPRPPPPPPQLSIHSLDSQSQATIQKPSDPRLRPTDPRSFLSGINPVVKPQQSPTMKTKNGRGYVIRRAGA